MEIERDLTLGHELMMQYEDGVSLICTVETRMILLTNVIPLNSIKILFNYIK